MARLWSGLQGLIAPLPGHILDHPVAAVCLVGSAILGLACLGAWLEARR